MLKLDKRTLNKQEFITLLNELNSSNKSIAGAEVIPINIDDYEFTANVVIIPVGDDKIVNYDMNYVKENGEEMFRKMIFSDPEQALKHTYDMVAGYVRNIK